MEYGLTFITPKKTKSLLKNDITIEIFYANSGLLHSKHQQNWNTTKDYRLSIGEFIVKSHVKYFNHAIWKTSTRIILVDKKKTIISLKYPFLTTSKAKVSIY